jgi:hypothetical protein
MNEIQTQNKKTFYKLVEGNYKITLINKREFVVELEQYKKLMSMLNNETVIFVSINDSIVNKHRIDMIDPTKELTPSEQVEELNKKKVHQEEINKYTEEEEIRISKEEQSKELEKQFFNNKYGVNKWTKWANPFGKEDRHIVNADDRKELAEYTKTKLSNK